MPIYHPQNMSSPKGASPQIPVSLDIPLITMGSRSRKQQSPAPWYLGCQKRNIIHSHRDLDKDCWLFLDLKPPYYVEIEINQISFISSPYSYKWDQYKLILGDLCGKNDCLMSPRFPQKVSPCRLLQPHITLGIVFKYTSRPQIDYLACLLQWFNQGCIF